MGLIQGSIQSANPGMKGPSGVQAGFLHYLDSDFVEQQLDGGELQMGWDCSQLV